MKIVIAPDSFKESLSAKQVCESIEAGFSQVFPDAEYVHLPLADGGEGTVEVLLQELEGEVRHSQVMGPLGEPIMASWALLDNAQTALIEFAAASGLDLITSEHRNPAIATSFGTGELIKEALNHGVTKVILGLGGSATNDAGAGIAQALGAKLLNNQGNEIISGGAALAEIATVDLSCIHPRSKDVEFVVACDVANPLVGENGASHVFGPQKGATPEMVLSLDSAISHFASVSSRHTLVNHSDSQCFGAAGGSPMGLSLVFDIQIKPGIEMVLDVLEADKVLEGADLVITGEGQMDNQTLQGKTPFGIAKLARSKGIPTIGIAGSLGHEIDNLYSTITSTFGTVRSPQSLEQVLNEASKNLTRMARNIAATLKLGAQILD
ncbi:glycerate kinase [Agarivorans sp. B2Z047]|uniref:glycerate kinase n=1 Tax=Agarivorans sp. B2Z047 TaxID=2652721 RepID=UPI001406359F|nr:glycerate kinase [Agarivorans sp. B2Z047]MPW31981.1 glycerate kinase [Agarivorans sp. B2Z047]UQN41953.1 glycerate kinase [Agarivorans sp. B2Z047]